MNHYNIRETYSWRLRESGCCNPGLSAGHSSTAGVACVICLAAALPADSNPFILPLLCTSSSYQDNINSKTGLLFCKQAAARTTRA